MKIQIDDLRLLRILFRKTDGYTVSGAILKTRLSPRRLALAVGRLASINFVSEGNDRLQVTEAGREWLLAHQTYLKPEERSWRSVPENVKRGRGDMVGVYVPKVSRLHPMILEYALKNGVDELGEGRDHEPEDGQG